MILPKSLLCIFLLTLVHIAFCTTIEDYHSIIKAAEFSQNNVKPASSPNTQKDFDTYAQFKLPFYVLLAIYQKGISTQDEPACMFHPSCSEFTKQALRQYGILGIIMGADRVERCNGLGAVYYKKGADPHARIPDPIHRYHYRTEEPFHEHQ